MRDERFFTIDIATKVGRVSKGQAATWAKSGFFVPSVLYSTARRPYAYLYSFADLLALRVIFVLRSQFQVPLSEAQIAAGYIRSTRDIPWSMMRVWIQHRRVFLSEQGGSDVSIIELGPLAAEVTEEADKLWYRGPDDYGKVERKRNVMNGALVVKGTRIPVSTVVALVNGGWDIDRILQGYPTLHQEDIQGVMRYVEEHQQVA
jgi:uncharacterized protein (DUF433 family)